MLGITIHLSPSVASKVEMFILVECTVLRRFSWASPMWSEASCLGVPLLPVPFNYCGIIA